MKFIQRGTRVAMRDHERTLSADDLLSYSTALSKQLTVNPGERVVIFSENQLYYAAAILAVWKCRAIAVLVDIQSSEEEFTHILKDSFPTHILASKEKLEEVKSRVQVGEHYPEILCFEQSLSLEMATDFSIEDLKESALILYTSGTTGKAKGVVLSFENIYTNMRAIRAGEVILEEEDSFLIVLPQHHIFTVACILTGLHLSVRLDFVYQLDSESLRKAFAQFKPTVFPGVPRLFEILHSGIMNRINKQPIARLLFKISRHLPYAMRKKIFKKVQDGFGGNISILVSGGAKLAENIIDDLRTLGFDILEGYGMTECAPMISFNRRKSFLPAGALGSGLYLEECEIKISEEGEVLTRGPHVMKGYFNNPQATQEVMSVDGFLKTGDRGEIRDGILYLQGRLKEMIVLSNGKNIDPNAIEQAIKAEDKIGLIQEIAMVEYQQKLMAVIYPNVATILKEKISNVEAVLREILNWYNAKSKSYLRVLDLKIVQEELPKTRLSKIKRFMLPELIEKSSSVKKEHMADIDSETFRKLKQFLVDLKQTEIYADSHLEFDIGIDSLEFLELQNFISKSFGLLLQAQDFVDKLIVYQLSDYIEKNKQFSIDQTMNFQEILQQEYRVKIPKGRFILPGRWISQWGLKKRCRLTVKGIENIPNRNVIFAGNHQSFVDGFIFLAALPYPRMRQSFYIAKHTNFNRLWKRFLGKNVNAIIMDINANAMNSVQAAASILKREKNLIIFPEGTRTPDGKIYPFKRSFAELSTALQVPVVPFVIHGAYEAFPKTAKKLREMEYRDIVIEFLAPVLTTEVKVCFERVEEAIHETYQKLS